MSNQPIFVTQPYLPPLGEFLPYLEKIWGNKVLTNNGPFHQELEAALCEYLGVKHLSLFTNATLALITALQALRITGEVITTPYSFVATAHSLMWNNIKPVFVDVDPRSCNLDPEKIERMITPQTTAIMPVHCYGRPCDVEKIQAIADTYGLKVIYDAAHAFGVRHQGNSILQYGDMSILSFHATKVFNTFEGGAIICQDERSKQRIDYLKNFGFANETTVIATGINGKMSEFNAALGLLQLKHIDRAIARRRQIDRYYRQQLKSIPGLVPMTPESDHLNQSYFPIMVSPEFPLSRDQLYEHLKRHQIHGRRYFYPLISDFPMYRSLPSAKSSNLPAARSLADRVICLPIYPDLSDDQVKEIVQVLADSVEDFNFHSQSSESINEVPQTKNLSDALEDLSDLETVSSMFTPLLGRAPRDLLPNQMAGFGV
jgi:dTDP-4-amino-4,6-dideoxygalactose transaminase